MCGYAGREGWGGVQGDGAGTDDEDGGRVEHDLEAMTVLGVAYVVEVGMLLNLPIGDQRLGGVIIECCNIAGDTD